MYFGLSNMLCCIRPKGSVNFERTAIEFNGRHAYIDVFCTVDKTTIYESDYLFLTETESLRECGYK